ncbi:MAG: hypothetical protein ACLQBK_21155 [Candidatus Sulfotelmatobacter sp.]
MRQNLTSGDPLNRRSARFESIAVDGAVVVTVTATEADPFSVREDWETVQFAFDGAPVQAN